jgi:tRNA (guanosine-2'-O-)-methyltransferase
VSGPQAPAAGKGKGALAAASPELVCEALGPLLVDGRRERIDAVIDARLGGLTLLIENLHDPHNGAAVLRSAEAFGLSAVHVVEGIEPFRFSSEVTQGCEKWMDVVRHARFGDAERALRAAGFALYAAVPGVEKTIADLDFSRPAALLVGNEHAGLTGEALAAADERFAVPLPGMTRSLNLSVAAALVLAPAAERRRAAVGQPGDLDAPARAALRARFYAASVRGAADVVARHVGRL